jgi:hypothetical protein
MKKAILAVVIPSILGASSAFAGIDLVKNDDFLVNFNGDIDLKLLYKENNDVNTSSIDANFDDFDFTFKYYVTDGLTLIAETDWTSESDVKSGVVNAGVWAGFKTNYGLLRFGYQENSFDPFGIDSSELTSAGIASGDLDGDGTMHPESIVYEHKINNVWFSGTYGYEGAAKDQSRQLQIAVRYIDKNLNYGAGIGNTKLFNKDKDSVDYGVVTADGTYAQAEVDYTWGKLRTAALVSYLKNDTNDRELNGYEIDVTYMITPKLRFAAGWDRIDQDMGANEDDNSIDNYYLALKYKWNKYAAIHAELGQRDGEFAAFNKGDKAFDEKLAGIMLDLDF